MMKKKWITLTTIIGIILIGTLIAGPVMSNIEIPKYDVVTAEKNIEIRHYLPMIVAEVQVEGKRKQAIGDGFRLLANYIFGNNTSQHDIAMTAPVQQQKSQKISMTAPVQQESIGQSWKVSFVMPSKYSMTSLPKPNNDRVTLKEVPSKKFAVIRFSGTSSNKNLTKHEKQLMEYILANQIKMNGSFKFAFYRLFLHQQAVKLL